MYHWGVLPDFRTQFPRKLSWKLPWTSVGMVGMTEFATDRTAVRAVAIAADFRGNRRKLPWKLPWTSVGMVGMTEFATDRTAVRALAIAADFCGNRRASEDCRVNGRGRPRMAVEISSVGRPRKLPWQLPQNYAGFCGDCRVAALPWQ